MSMVNESWSQGMLAAHLILIRTYSQFEFFGGLGLVRALMWLLPCLELVQTSAVVR